MKKQLSDYEGKTLTNNIDDNLEFFHALLKKDAVLRTRELKLRPKNLRAALLYMDSMVDTAVLNESVIRPMLLCENEELPNDALEILQNEVLFACELETSDDIGTMLKAVLYGDTLLLIDGEKTAVVIGTKGWRTRGVSEPGDERVLQGPREGFDEALMLNAGMLRRKLPTPDLCMESMSIGRKTDTKIFICYLESLVEPKTLKELKRRLQAIDIDGILDSNYINELIKPHRLSLFKTIGSTERPDIVAARLLEGRIALMVDGTPVVLTLPYLFCENFQSDDDYYLNFYVAGIGRILRYLSFFLSVLVPAFYLALTTYHPELLPTSFMITISAARGGIPFPSFLECILLIMVFEVLKETGIRMQQSVGHALSIVGGLVVGQAAVEAKIVSAPMLIIVALGGICGLVVPRLKGVCFFWRLILVLCATLLGLYGVFAGTVLFMVSVFSLESFGVDYTSTAARFSAQSMKDTLIRAPWWCMITRPFSLTKDKIRQRVRGKNR